MRIYRQVIKLSLYTIWAEYNDFQITYRLARGGEPGHQRLGRHDRRALHFSPYLMVTESNFRYY